MKHKWKADLSHVNLIRYTWLSCFVTASYEVCGFNNSHSIRGDFRSKAFEGFKFAFNIQIKSDLTVEE